MSTFEILVHRWLSGVDPDPPEREAFGEVEIRIEGIPITEVEDTLAGTVSHSIFVSALPVARWLVLNWWRLRFEGEPVGQNRTLEWRRAHDMASIEGGYAWPGLELYSDGSSIQVKMHAEDATDVAAIRYLRSCNRSFDAKGFETGVDRFIEAVVARLEIRLPEYRELVELKEELDQERRDPVLARNCRLQAIAGFHPGDAEESWVRELDQLESETGTSAVEEVLRLLNGSKATPNDVLKGIAAIRSNGSRARIDWLEDWRKNVTSRFSRDEKPWERGYRLAKQLRQMFSLPTGPVTQQKLQELVGASVKETRFDPGVEVWGAVRREKDIDFSIALPNTRPINQRFGLARLIACAAELPRHERFLPVLSVATALQKTTRAFAQEFLCPWEELKAFVGNRGLTEEKVEAAADHFEVSEIVVRNAWMNHSRIAGNQFAY